MRLIFRLASSHKRSDIHHWPRGVDLERVSDDAILISFSKSFDPVFISFFPNDVLGDSRVDQMLPTLGDPAHIQNKFAIGSVAIMILVGGGEVERVNSEWSQHKVTLLITSLSLNEESTSTQYPIHIDFLAIPIFSFVSVEIFLD